MMSVRNEVLKALREGKMCGECPSPSGERMWGGRMPLPIILKINF